MSGHTPVEPAQDALKHGGHFHITGVAGLLICLSSIVLFLGAPLDKTTPQGRLRCVLLEKMRLYPLPPVPAMIGGTSLGANGGSIMHPGYIYPGTPANPHWFDWWSARSFRKSSAPPGIAAPARSRP